MKIVILSGRYNLTSLYYSGFVCVLAMVHNEVCFFFSKDGDRKKRKKGGREGGRERGKDNQRKN